MLKILCVLALLLCACQPTGPLNADPDAPPAPLPYGLGAVEVAGSCQAQLDVVLVVGPMALPLALRADTTASPDGTRGQVSIDIGGLVTALCLVSPDVAPEGRCAVGGLLPRMAAPAGGRP